MYRRLGRETSDGGSHMVILNVTMIWKETLLPFFSSEFLITYLFALCAHK